MNNQANNTVSMLTNIDGEIRSWSIEMEKFKFKPKKYDEFNEYVKFKSRSGAVNDGGEVNFNKELCESIIKAVVDGNIEITGKLKIGSEKAKVFVGC